MSSKTLGNAWQKKDSWKLLRTPTLEVIAVIMVVLGAAVVVVQAETETRSSPLFPLPVVHR